MNKFAQSLLLALVVAAPVAISTPAVHAAPAKVAPASSTKAVMKNHRVANRRLHHRVTNRRYHYRAANHRPIHRNTVALKPQHR